MYFAIKFCYIFAVPQQDNMLSQNGTLQQSENAAPPTGKHIFTIYKVCDMYVDSVKERINIIYCSLFTSNVYCTCH